MFLLLSLGGTMYLVKFNQDNRNRAAGSCWAKCSCSCGKSFCADPKGPGCNAECADACPSKPQPTKPPGNETIPASDSEKCKASGGFWCAGCGGFCTSGATKTCNQAQLDKCGEPAQTGANYITGTCNAQYNIKCTLRSQGND